ncbi:hypothetical protein K443DRAFT_125001 [Laccaria amethystina LaAM-08-1]|uniref:Unplaced genomic scaffold K443scaffold_235, whole genome shotgun sequence n=1 Tax=Laccaria amethystina LaAM-08-1 TaxID=1095629 RepID=A0A0C9WJN7_9AGAR|nr:hypothetical protein K443DRAFT_125001 [Laccaria amethystina LaAM-08-1]
MHCGEVWGTNGEAQPSKFAYALVTKVARQLAGQTTCDRRPSTYLARMYGREFIDKLGLGSYRCVGLVYCDSEDAGVCTSHLRKPFRVHTPDLKQRVCLTLQPPIIPRPAEFKKTHELRAQETANSAFAQPWNCQTRDNAWVFISGACSDIGSRGALATTFYVSPLRPRRTETYLETEPGARMHMNLHSRIGRLQNFQVSIFCTSTEWDISGGVPRCRACLSSLLPSEAEAPPKLRAHAQASASWLTVTDARALPNANKTECVGSLDAAITEPSSKRMTECISEAQK